MSEKLLNLEQLAELSSESLAVWRKRIYRREVPYLKLGRNVRVRHEDYAAWLAARLVPAESLSWPALEAVR
jgi:hypothetical protein